MATQGVDKPKAKKRSFLLRDLFKVFRIVSKVLPCDKTKLISKSNKHKRKIHNESERDDQEHKSNVRDDPKAANLQETKKVGNKVEGVSFCKVRSYRLDNRSVGTKTTFSRSSSHSVATATATANPTTQRSKSTNYGNPIMYSNSSTKVVKPSPTEKKLKCTLEELYNGCTKKINIRRDVITSSGQMSEEEEMVEIKVKPGWKEGTKVTFEGKGNEAMGSIPADLTFMIVEKKHNVFKREGDDLEMSIEVSLLEALTGYELSVSLPNGEKINLKIQDVIHPGYVKVIQGKGMPIPTAKGKKRGELRVRFLLKFPELTNGQRTKIQDILVNSS